MAGRVRPSGSVNVPTEAESAEARTIVAAARRDLAEAADSVTIRLSRIANPVERAKATMEIRRFTASDLTAVTDGIFRDAVIEAYARGKAEHGWYGYGALAEELDLSRARVQQVVNGSWKKRDEKDPALVESIRDEAQRTRTVRRLAAAGRPVEEIVEETGLSAAAVKDILD